MRKLTFALKGAFFNFCRISIILLCVTTISQSSWGQCTPQNNSISGTVFEDIINDGIFKDADIGISNVKITAYDNQGNIAGSSVSDVNGEYQIANLPNGGSYRLMFESTSSFYSGVIGEDNRSSVQFVESPACEINYGLTRDNSGCGANPDIALTCFVQGTVDENPTVETIISLEHDFAGNSTVSKIASQGETGSIWGIVQDPKTEAIYSAAFVKQYAGLKYTPYTILKTELSGSKNTTAFVDVNTLIPQNLPGLSVTDIDNCDYGSQVGRVGLGSLILSDDGSKLYTAVLDEGLVVGIDVNNPDVATTEVFAMPRPANIDPNEEYRIFALSWKDDLIYVGGTITASYSRDKNVSTAVIMTLDPKSGNTAEIFRTNYIQGHWQDSQPASLKTSHWFTDIDFTDSGEILISLTDRIGHRYCKASTNRLDQQFPDLLIVGFDSSTNEWTLENNGSINGRSGSGVNNNQGPGGGEFFGFEFWPSNPSYHSETALGSIFVLPGSNEVVASVYDPLINSYSGGLHRYSTIDGSKTGAIELYSHTTFPVFGKATGFGDITGICSVKNIEIGNYVWNDTNGNGLQDPGENGIPNVSLNLYNSDCDLIGSTTTDEFGVYAFNNSNVDGDGDGTFDGVFPDVTYYVGIDNAVYDEATGLYTLGTDEFTICTPNSGTASDDNIDCDAAYDPTSCLTSAFIEVNTSTTNHSFDIGLGSPSGFDLALKKEIVGNPYAKVGEELTFMITVYNQGGVSASEVTITDYLTTGYSFDESQNNGWELKNGVLTSTINQKILPGTNVSKILRLTVKDALNASYVNVAEISEAKDLAGEIADDVDSTPDAIYDNDNGGIPFTDSDDQLNGVGMDDEDDHDPAVPKIFDLAVKITLSDDKFYFGGDVVKFDINVYNQGNVDADFIELMNYIPTELTLNTSLSDGWELSGDNATLQDDEILKVGEVRDYCIYLDVAKGVLPSDIVNFVEISQSSPVDSPESFDFDSSPDKFNTNDKGGEVYTNTDNEINDHGITDEDDHDPVVIKSRYIDLALMKTAGKKGVRTGENVEFKIEVLNQGSGEVTEITIVDYIPSNMILNDDAWDLRGDGSATRTLTLENPLTKGQNEIVYITLQVKEEVDAMSFVNYAEIISAKDENDIEVGDRDIDSSPDDINDNDKGGVPDTSTDNDVNSGKDVDEDDHDPARVSIIEGNIESTECLENATNSVNGQFEDVFKITAPAGETWYLFNQSNYYDSTSPDPIDGPLVELVLGETTTMDEMPVDAEVSMYTFTVIREDGKDGYIVFRNLDTDDLETFNVSAMMYEDIVITGDQALCDGEVKTYCVANPDAMLDYEWTVSGGATFVDNGDCIEVDWSSVAPNSDYTVSVAADSGCNVPGLANISIGTSSGAMSCLGHTNMSLDGDCEVPITPQLILTSDILPGQAYSVMLTTESGEVIPNATLTSEHIGTTVTAKVIDGCSGNACWGTIFVEDKLKPTLVCEDAFISCNKVDEFSGPFAEDNCGSPVEVILLNETINYVQCEDHTAEIYRSYQAVDAQGNTSEICEMTIYVERIDLDDIVFPDNFTMMEGTALNCDAYDLDMDGVADTDITGVPTYNGEYVYPDFDQYCNTALTFEDDIRFINGVKKIKRTWTAWEWWCSTTLKREHEQYIEVRDTESPDIVCPEDITISAFAGNCEGIVSLPLPEVSDECSDQVTIQTITQITSVIEEGDSRVVSFPFSTSPYTITYRATDAAGNSSECEMSVTVIDDIAPIAICDQNTIVGLNSNGEGYLYAMNLDDGSYDACQLTEMMVRRVGDTGPFTDKVLFTCADLGAPIMVELKVYDAGGLSNSCMATVVVQDKHAPEVNDLPSVEIECGQDFYPLSQFGDFTYNDACDVTIVEDSIISINTCGTGTITRTFTVMDSQGSDVGTQTITVVNSDPFDEMDIESWPADFEATITSCDDDETFHPDNLPTANAYPIWNDDACDQVSAGYHDEVYPLLNDPNSVCYKIIRTWTIIDWCQLDMNDDPIEFSEIQVIKVKNTKKPDPIVVEPEVETIVSSDCDTGLINFTATTDDCNPDLLMWTIQVDFDQDFTTTGVYDITRTGFGPVSTINETVPQGTHTIVFSFSNGCGNTETTSRTVNIINNIPPSILCLSKTSIGLSPWNIDDDPEPDTEAACVHVDTLAVDSGTFHPCGTPFELSFSQDSIVKTMCFDCDDIGINLLTIYAIDINGNISSCNDTLEVQDNNDVDICLDVKECVTEAIDTTISLQSGCFIFVDGTGFDIEQISEECGDLTITNNLTGTSTLDGAILQLGVTEIIWTISNGSMMSDCPQVITVIDEIDPTIDCANDLAVQTSDFGDCEYTNSGSGLDPTVNDNCSIADVYHDYVTAPSVITLDGATFPIGITVVTWTVEDGSGNSAQCTVTITVEEDEAPTISCSQDATFNDTDDATSLCNHTVTDTSLDPTVSDECSTTISVTHNYGAAPSNSTLQGATFDLGTTVVTFTAEDEFGNSATCQVAITVVDNVDPSIACADSEEYDDTDDGVADCQYEVEDDELDPTVSDNCTSFTLIHDYAPAPSNSTLAGAVFELGTTNVIFTVTDDAGNSNTCEVVITVNDDVSPECTTQTDTTINIGMSQMFVFTPSILTQPITDNCDSDLTYSFSPPSVDCDDVGQTIVVTITATDDAGNSTMCPINVFVNETAEIECNPMDITVDLNENGEVTITADQVVDPGSSMCGTMPDVNIMPSMFTCDNIGVNAVTIQIIVGDDTTECVAMVTVQDVFSPGITCAPDMLVGDSEDGDFSCSHTVSNTSLDPVSTIDNCDDFTVTHNYVSAPSNTTLNGATFPLGATTVLWTITDNGGNGQSSVCDVQITVVDDVDPTCVDQPVIDVDIPVGENLTLDISLLPNPYTDNCGIASFSFNPSTLDCTNEGITDVTLTVTDNAGNDSACPVQFNVTVLDDLSCSFNVETVFLDENGEVLLDAEEIVDVSGGVCNGNTNVTLSSTMFQCNDIIFSPVDITIFVNGDSCGMGSLMIADTIGPDVVCSPITVSCVEFETIYNSNLIQLLNQTEAVDSIWDNCPATLETTTTIDSSALNDCNYGIMTRTTISFDPLSNLSDTCIQEITIEGPVDALTQADVDGILPDTVVITECVIGDFMIDTIAVSDLENLVDCGQFSISMEDVSISTGCPDTIVRTYSIDAICQDEEFEFVQIVILIDDIDPVLEAIADTSVVVDLNCLATLDIAGLATATDDCTPSDMIGLTYTIDGVTTDAGILAELEVGTFDVLVTAADGCGNTDTTSFEVSVIDTIPLEVACVKVIVFIDSTTMTVDVPAEQNITVVGNCDDEAEIFVTYDSLDLTDVVRTFDCDDAATFVEVNLFVWEIVNGDTLPFDLTPDDPTVFTNLCKGEIEIQDPFNVCGTTILGITGEIFTADGVGIPDYSLTLNGSGLDPIFSNDQGGYAFPPMPMGGSYNVSTYNNDDVMNGVSTLDLIMIQRHILGIDPFESPYLYIAADINNNEKVTGSDLVELRKMILGIHSEFPNNMSWRTVDANYVFPDPNDPWVSQIPEGYKIPSLDHDMNINFIGIKIGDVNGNVQVGLHEESVSTRSNDAKVLNISSEMHSNVITVRSDEFIDVAGLQFTLELNDQKIESIRSDYFDQSEIGFYEVTKGVYNISIAGTQVNTIGLDETVLEILTDCNTCTLTPMTFKLGQSGLANELYLNATLETVPLAIEVESENEETSFVVYQNNPNPWTSYTKVNISLPNDDVVNVKVYDMNGRIVNTSTTRMNAGMNTIEFDNSKIVGSGVFYYEVSTSTRSERYKMIKLN
ncbi:MAG: HYR domain-containing protein [Saprospiraceae bacterium]|nr:HYR domain-containing protein [Saprospiraceae bacterium]